MIHTPGKQGLSQGDYAAAFKPHFAQMSVAEHVAPMLLRSVNYHLSRLDNFSYFIARTSQSASLPAYKFL